EKDVFDLQGLLTQGEPDKLKANVLLQPGDTLLLPESEHKFYVLGEVAKADIYPLKPDAHLLEAIVTAGGATREADLANVVLIRKGEKGQPVAHHIDLKDLIQKGDMARNEALQEGDVIFVPSRKQKRPMLDYFGLLYPLTSLLS